MSTGITTAPKPTSVKLRDWMARTEVIAGIGSALEGWMPPEQFVSQCLIVLQKPELAACSDQSKFEAIHTCAMLQLSPALGHVALIPRAGVVSVMPQWQGYKSLMERHPDVLEVKATLVYEGDTYTFDAETQQIRDHKCPDPFSDERKILPGSLDGLKGGYVRIKWRDGRPDTFHLVPKRKILEAQSCAQTKAVWHKWPEEMAIKTCLRNTFNRRIVPIDIRPGLQRLVELDDVAMENTPLPTGLDAPTRSESILTKLQAAVEDAPAEAQTPILISIEEAQPADDAPIDSEFAAFVDALEAADTVIAVNTLVQRWKTFQAGKPVETLVKIEGPADLARKRIRDSMSKNALLPDGEMP